MIRTLPRTVIVLSVVSLLNDMASDMVIPLLPILLSSVFAAGPVMLGLIEGVADAVASFLKLWAGRHSDALRGRRKFLAVFGYTLSNVARPLLGVASSVAILMTLRSIDRVGKGVRSAPRDAMIVDTTPAAIRGAAFGFHRALDNAGAVLGSLLAAAALTWSNANLAQVILWSAVPGLLGVLLLAFGVREPVDAISEKARKIDLSPLRWSLLSPSMRKYLWVLLVFTFARTSETFLVLRGHEMGFSAAHLLVLWAALNLAKSLSAVWGGILADRVARVTVMNVSWMAYAASYLLLSSVDTAVQLWVLVIVYGVFAGLSEGAERALIGDLAVKEERGTAFGWYNMMLGLAAIPAGLLFGTLWASFGATYAWLFAGVLAAIATTALRAVVVPELHRSGGEFARRR